MTPIALGPASHTFPSATAANEAKSVIETCTVQKRHGCWQMGANIRYNIHSKFQYRGQLFDHDRNLYRNSPNRIEGFQMLSEWLSVSCCAVAHVRAPWSHKVFAIVPGGLLLWSMPGSGQLHKRCSKHRALASGFACRVPQNPMVYRNFPWFFIFFPHWALCGSGGCWMMLAPPGRSPRSKMTGKHRKTILKMVRLKIVRFPLDVIKASTNKLTSSSGTCSWK